MNNKVVVLVGPTASGKTKISVELAKQFNGSIVSADSMQIYRHMDIGTAKPTQAERDGIPHYMMDVISANEDFSVADYVRMADDCVREILSCGRLPFLVGGTGLYVSSFLDHLQFTQAEKDEHYRAFLNQIASEHGANVLKQLLDSVDAEAAEKIHVNNVKRLIRALEIYKTSGLTMTEQNLQSRQTVSPYTFCVIGLYYLDRAQLYERIDRRVDEMFEAGLEQEVRALLHDGIVTPDCNAMQAIGYKQFLPYLRGECDLTEVRERIKTESRHYAKRQLTWLRRDERIQWFAVDDIETDFYGLINKIVKTIENFIKV